MRQLDWHSEMSAGQPAGARADTSTIVQIGVPVCALAAYLGGKADINLLEKSAAEIVGVVSTISALDLLRGHSILASRTAIAGRPLWDVQISCRNGSETGAAMSDSFARLAKMAGTEAARRSARGTQSTGWPNSVTVGRTTLHGRATPSAQAK